MDKIKWHQVSLEQLLHVLQAHKGEGLSEEEAILRQAQYGQNELAEGGRVLPITLFLNQFKDFMVLVLICATIVSSILGEYLDAITIIAIIILNGMLGFIQEFRAECSLLALKQLSAPVANVIRNGKLGIIPACKLVPGDIVQLESGDRIPADIRWVETSSCYVEESALTGESVPVGKHAQSIDQDELPLGDMKNIGFMGTMVTRGSGQGVVIRTGMNTEIGKIADLIKNTEAMGTPLQHRLEQLGKILIVVALSLTALVVITGIMHGQPAMAMFLTGVSLAVAAIPEGLPAIVTISLALGVQRMIKREAIVRKLPSVETLGCASVICSDKTGTLTQNKMTVTHIWIGGRALEVSREGHGPTGGVTQLGKQLDLKHDQSLRRLLQISALCNNAEIEETNPTNSKEYKVVWDIKGDPTEGALLVLAAKLGVTPQSLSAAYERLAELPFDSDCKRMSVVVKHQGRRFVLAKGAPDVLLDRCSYVLWDKKVIPFTATLKQRVTAANEAMAKQALRVLGLAYREMKPSEPVEPHSIVESRLVFTGLVGMIDPPRGEAREAIAICRCAGIKTVIITGDHQLTAEAIANQLGVIPRDGLIINGTQLDMLNDDELNKVVDYAYVYARVSPKHKLRIVRALQHKGHVVAMTGDGVNDAPAIKAADIGISMGKTGTDVSKEASALILSNDNFATIVAAIEEGRGIYENIRKFIRYLLASNVGEILVMFFAMVLGLPLPLVPIQILWVNLVTDGLPAMALGVDQAENDLMEQRPRSAKENIFSHRLGWKIISRGILIGVCTLIAFWLTWSAAPDSAAQLTRAQSVAFSTLVLAQLIHVFDCRSSRSIFHRNILQNRYLVLAVVSSIILLLGVLYIVPLQLIFKTVPLQFRDWAITFVMAGIPTFLVGIGSVLSGKGQDRPNRVNQAYISNRRVV